MTVTNFSLLNPNNFRFYIPRAEYLSFFTQSVFLPTVSLGSPTEGTPFVAIPYPGDQLEYDPLRVEFLVDEDLNGFIEIFNWMKGLGFPETFEQYNDAVSGGNFNSYSENLLTDIVVISQTGAKNLNIKFTFKDAFPISISPPTISTTIPGGTVVTSTAVFKYTLYDVETI